MDTMSPERLDILLTVGTADEPLSPADVAGITGKERHAVGKLMRSMRRDGQLVSVSEGRYDVPPSVETEHEPETSLWVSGHQEEVSAPTVGGESPVDKPIADGEMYVYSARDSGMISHGEGRRRKGYQD